MLRKPYWNDAPFWSSEVPDTISFAPIVFGELYETRYGDREFRISRFVSFDVVRLPDYEKAKSVIDNEKGRNV